jgi:ATP-dependent HslUV protease, peptidase subunit HslV
MIVADKDITLLMSGNGDVLEPQGNILAIGSGGHFAEAAALALEDIPDMTAEEIALKSMKIAAKMCIYTNDSFTSLKLNTKE